MSGSPGSPDPGVGNRRLSEVLLGYLDEAGQSLCRPGCCTGAGLRRSEMALKRVPYSLGREQREGPERESACEHWFAPAPLADRVHLKAGTDLSGEKTVKSPECWLDSSRNGIP